MTDLSEIECDWTDLSEVTCPRSSATDLSWVDCDWTDEVTCPRSSVTDLSEVQRDVDLVVGAASGERRRLPPALRAVDGVTGRVGPLRVTGVTVVAYLPGTDTGHTCRARARSGSRHASGTWQFRPVTKFTCPRTQTQLKAVT